MDERVDSDVLLDDQSPDDGQTSDGVMLVEMPNKMTVAVVTQRHDDLPSAAKNAAAFINTVREATSEPFTLDVQVAVNPFGSAVRQAPVVGFMAEQNDGDDDMDDDDDDCVGRPMK